MKGKGMEKNAYHQSTSLAMGMDSLLFFYVQLLAFFFTMAASQRNSTISPNSVITPTTNPPYWLSPSGLYAFGFYPRGNGFSLGVFLAGIPQRTVVWMAARNDPPLPSNSTLQFAMDGRLILQSPQQGDESDKVIANPNGAAVVASMLDTGNFVLYNSNLNVTWQSFDYPTDTILEGQVLPAGKELFSSASDEDPSSGIFRISMQTDGNLVQYPINTPNIGAYSYWAPWSGIAGNGDKALTLADDGLLYIYNGTGYNLINITTGGLPQRDFIYRATIDVDGIFRLYSYNVTQKGNWSAIWSTTNNLCAPKGLCGLNAFCISNDQTPDCQCLPGYTYIKEGNRTSGCERNFTASCSGSYDHVNFTIRAIRSTQWEAASYAVVTLPTEEACRTECSRDCNCDVAMYESGSCKKQKLPLRFGRRDLGSSNTLFVKVGEPTMSPNVTDSLKPQEKKERVRMDILVASLCLIAFASIMLLVSVVLIQKSRVWEYKMISKHGTSILMDVAPKSFIFDELRKVTKDFAEEIGKGAFGTVYKGTTSNGQVVAVKRLGRVSGERENEFHTEMKIIGKTHHRNLVRLIGYCLDGSNRLLVYEYMSNGSVAGVLFAQERKLSWDEKMGIARNIARGLLYLHEECETQIIHCDIKPQNILIDEYGCAKIADFGLSKLLKPDQTNTFTNIRGTRGYVAPEWHRNLPITVKVDVYSFGIVLLELMCCRRNVDHNLPDEEAVLEEWVYDCFQSGELDKLAVDEVVDRRQFERMVKVALWCILEDPSLRPTMRKVLLMLEGTIDIPVPPCPSSFLSAI